MPKNLLHFVLALGITVPLWSISDAYARPEILDEWKIRYADAPDTLTHCQLCHRDPTGGDGWNGYGWLIRGIREVLGSTAEAIAEAESANSDADPNSITNLDEIGNGTQPGWTDGSNNIIYYKDSPNETISAQSVIDDQNPATEIDAVILANLDLPAPLGDPIAAAVFADATASTETIASGLISPVHAAPAPGLDNLLFVVEQTGEVRKIDLPTNQVLPDLFIDLGPQMVSLSNSYDERGLLGLAFHPDFATNGKFYTHHSEPVIAGSDFPLTNQNHQSVIAEWQAIDPATEQTTASLATKRVVLRIDQPYSNHNGGAIEFGADGFLYIALGDGGSAEDPEKNGLNGATPLGAILRIDPDGSTSANGQYAVPLSNPFVGNADILDEIFAYGFRNPYRFAFDRLSGQLVVADVGQYKIEEIGLVQSGENHGWNSKEGSFAFYPNSLSSNSDGFISDNPAPRAPLGAIDPVLEYDHDEGQSVVGGFVYRGQQIPGISGVYIFGDWSGDGGGLGRLFYSNGFNTMGAVVVDDAPGVGMYLTGFGQDANGEIYLLGKTQVGPQGTSGMVKKLVAFDTPETESDDQLCIPVLLSDGKATLICI